MSKEIFLEFDGDAKKIAKEIKKDLKHTFEKEFKFSVRSKKYSGGQSINIDIKKAPEYACYIDTVSYTKPRTYVKPYVVEQIKEIVEHYNYDNSNGMIDYFDVGFYPNIDDMIR